MDVVLELADSYVLDGLWAKSALGWGRENVYRQSVSLYGITLVGILFLYFGIAGASYAFLFDKRMMKHPRFLKNQIRMEIKMSLIGFPILDFMTLPWFVGECQGYSKLYSGVENSPFGNGLTGGIAYIVLSSAFFLWFTDVLIYLVHRVEHMPMFYKHVHKPHHKWVIPTPWASHAFHPLDGYLQSLPYHIFVYLFPLHKYTYLGLFVFVNLWTIAIHDSDMITGHPLENIINGPAHHTLHHMYFVYNYGQYFTWADKAGGSYRHPKASDDPLNAVLRLEEAREMLKKEKAMLAAQEVAEAQEAAAAAAAGSQQPTSSYLAPAATPSPQRTLSSLHLRRSDSERSYGSEGETDTESVQTASSVSEAHTPFDEHSFDGVDDQVSHAPGLSESDDEVFKRAFVANKKSAAAAMAASQATPRAASTATTTRAAAAARRRTAAAAN